MVRAELAGHRAGHARAGQGGVHCGAPQLPPRLRRRPPTSSTTRMPSSPTSTRSTRRPSRPSDRRSPRCAPSWSSAASTPCRHARRRCARGCGQRRGAAAVQVRLDVPTSMLYTSGTTGRPKGAVRAPGNPEDLRPLLELMGHTEDDVYITTGPLYHSGPGGYLGIAHLLGNTAVASAPLRPRGLAPAGADVSREHDVLCPGAHSPGVQPAR